MPKIAPPGCWLPGRLEEVVVDSARITMAGIRGGDKKRRTIAKGPTLEAYHVPGGVARPRLQSLEFADHDGMGGAINDVRHFGGIVRPENPPQQSDIRDRGLRVVSRKILKSVVILVVVIFPAVDPSHAAAIVGAAGGRGFGAPYTARRPVSRRPAAKDSRTP